MEYKHKFRIVGYQSKSFNDIHKMTNQPHIYLIFLHNSVNRVSYQFYQRFKNLSTPKPMRKGI